MTHNYYQLVGGVLAGAVLGLLLPETVWAQSATASPAVTSVNNFLTELIRILSGIAGLIATGFFVIGGLSYITSSGNPLALERAKRTLIFSAFGLVITIAAFSLSGLIADIGQRAFS